MEGWEVVVLTTVLTLLSLVVTAKITTKISYNNDVRKEIREKRAELYLSFYDDVESILKDKTLVFNREYLDILVSTKPQIKLLSSKATFQAYYEYYEYIRKEIHLFEQFCNENDPLNDSSRYEYCMDEKGNEQEIVHVSEWEIHDFEKLQEKYKRENKPDNKTISAYLEKLYQAMREDLGSNL